MKRVRYFSLLAILFVPLVVVIHAQTAQAIIASPTSRQAELFKPDLKSRCVDVIQYGDFEGTFEQVTSVWQAEDQALVFGTTSFEGNRGAALPAFTPYEPAIYQDFYLPITVSRKTAAILNLAKAVSHRGDPSPNPDDVLYFALRRQSGDGQFDIDLIPPIPLATGADMPNLDPNLNPPEAWRIFNLDIFEGLDPLPVVPAGTKLRVYIYARQPDGSPPEDTAFGQH